MWSSRVILATSAFGVLLPCTAQQQQRPAEALAIARAQLAAEGFTAADLDDLLVKDNYASSGNGVRHTYIRQRWQGIEIWNADIAVHQAPDGSLVKLNNGAWPHLAKRVNTTVPSVSAETALTFVLAVNAPGVPFPTLLNTSDLGRRLSYDGSALGDEPVLLQLMYQPVEDHLLLVWNVNHYMPDGSHWWNVRVDALTGQEVGRNDWVSQCAFDGTHANDDRDAPESAPPPAVPNDYNVYRTPVESPSHGVRAIHNAPWVAGGIASPFGWHDTNGAIGPEYTDTRGNNCRAQEDVDASNTGGARPTSATLDFDFALNLAGAPSTYLDAATTNLFYWNNLMHDVWYQYGYDEASGNFQQNNYGRGGLGNDWVNADAQDGSGLAIPNLNNANFATPPDGNNPRMQMYRWTYTTPNRDSDLDNCIIAHEYTHGISNRLVGGPMNVNCLGNAEQMGEGWSDWFGLMMTIEPGDQGVDRRGIGTYVLGQSVTGAGIRPAPYSTDFSQNNFTYAATNNTAATPGVHGVGFVWCSILWEVSWELINAYGFDPDLYNGTGGNNLAMQLVVDGMKLTPCDPGFVDGRDAILLADQINNGGANQNLLWSAFARRGLGVSASQGSTGSRTDQVEAYDTPMTTNVGVSAVLSPMAGTMLDCFTTPMTVSATIRNFGSQPQTNFPVRYQLDGGALVSQNYPGTLAAGSSATFTFAVPVTIGSLGGHTLTVSTALPGDMFAPNDQASNAITVVAGTNFAVPFVEGLATASPTPAGWSIQNPDGATTWGTTLLANGPGCVSSRAWSIDHYAYNGIGQEDRLLTPKIDLTTAIGSRLLFDHAYAPYGPGYYDAFRVDISTNCGANWTQLYYASGVALSTAPANTNAWQPAGCAQWQSHNIDLGAYDGQIIMLRFVAINGYGNWFYMDNVQVLKSGTLPVELLELHADTQIDGILLDWSTASELNSDRFEVERSTNMQDWSLIGHEDAAGSSVTTINYHFLDAAPAPGLNYYRLNMFDLDGSQEYSPVTSAKWSLNGPAIFPNPNDGTFWVHAAAEIPLEIFDALGSRVPYVLVRRGEGAMEIRLDRSAEGLYLVRIGAGEGEVIERVMITAR